VPDVLAVLSPVTPRGGRERRPGVGQQLVRLLVHAHHRTGRIIGPLVGLQDVLHAGEELLITRRRPRPARLVILGVAIAGHAVLAQLLYDEALVHVPAPAADLRAGADLMYYAGDIAELLLTFATVSTWRPRRKMPTPGRAAIPA
jgi:cytochrome c oxidase assembly factor CtaG